MSANLQELGIYITKDSLKFYVPAVRCINQRTSSTMSKLKGKLYQAAQQEEAEVSKQFKHATAAVKQEYMEDLNTATEHASQKCPSSVQAVSKDEVSLRFMNTLWHVAISHEVAASAIRSTMHSTCI